MTAPAVSFAETVEKYLNVPRLPTIWCPGCGHGIVIGSLIRALEETGIPRHETVVISGIGCSGRAFGYFNTCSFQTTHGRALAFATGVKLADPRLTVVVLMGDGDCASIGGNHFIHACRRNIDLTAIVMNNDVYGMTGGQQAPTTPTGSVTSTTPYGNPDPTFDLCQLARVAGASYVARTTTYHANQLQSYIRKALTHKGFALVEAVGACPTQYGRMNRLGDAVKMLLWQKENALSFQAAAKLSPSELAGRVLVGELVCEERPEYVASYQQVIEKARAARAARVHSEESASRPPAGRGTPGTGTGR